MERLTRMIHEVAGDRWHRLSSLCKKHSTFSDKDGKKTKVGLASVPATKSARHGMKRGSFFRRDPNLKS